MQIEVGSRIYCDGYYGTVMYHGPVQGSNGVWVGVSWDELGRGKHDGEYNGNRYFTCAPGHGSFARAEKLNFGISFMQALKSKYINETAQEADESEMYVTTVRDVKVPVELVGRQKAKERMKKLDLLPAVDLSGKYVCKIETPKKESSGVSNVEGEEDTPDLASIIPKVKEIDLSGALLHSWDQIFSLLDQLPSLQVLCLNSVVLKPPTYNPLPAYPNLHILVLNRTKISWEQVLDLRPVFPVLHELHLSSNSIPQFIDSRNKDNSNSEKITDFDHLMLLNLEGNQISDWNEINKFSHLPKLEHLILNENNIATLYHDREPTTFPALETLSLAHNQIGKWETVNELHFFPNLKRVRLNSNPVIGSLSQTVSRIGKLAVLNGANVNARERLDAERYYLRNIISTKSEANNPRYPELMEKHGGPDGINAENTATMSADKQFFSVTLRGPSGDHKKTIPGTMSVKGLELRHICGRLFNFTSPPQSLVLQPPPTDKSDVFPTPLTEDNMNMFDAGIVEWSVILCSEK